MVDMNTLPIDRLEAMQQAAGVVSETMRVLHKSGANVVGEILKTSDEFVQWKHVPKEDVYDNNSHCQYYYHAHPKSPEGTDLHDDEHGHFHTFIRGRGMPDHIKPAPLEDYDPSIEIGAVNTHVVGIGMDKMGVPMRLFTVNRWVTGEIWHTADDVISLLDGFEVDQIQPAWPVNLWITNMIALFQPQIEDLLIKRDLKIEEWKKQKPDTNIYEDRDFEVTAYLDINLSEHITALEKAIEGKA